MATEQQTLEDVARLVASEGAEVHHLCSAGVGTFSVAAEEGDGVDGVYALKVIGEPPPAAGRSAREFAALRRINHPNVVKYRGTGTKRYDNSDYRWLAMDFVEGSTLAQLLADGVVFDLPTAVRLLREAVSGAAALWGVRTTHGNLAADNVMITGSGGVVIVDLGMAPQVTSVQRPITATPEQAGESPTSRDWRADQFALGLLGYRIVTGTEAIAQCHVDHASQEGMLPTPRPAHDVNPAVPRRLSDVLATMLAPQLEDRFAEPAALQSDLEGIAKAIGPAGDVWVAPPSHELACQRDV